MPALPRFRSATLVALAGLICPALSLLGDPVNRLEDSPRHLEWVELPADGGPAWAFVAHPQVSGPAPVVIVIHENRGLTDWVRATADRLAAEGYLVIAPDYLSGLGPGGGRTSSLASSDAAREAISRVTSDRVRAVTDAALAHARSMPHASPSAAVAGFCWGGSQTFRYALGGAKINAAFVFYGTGPREGESAGSLACPVHGFYGGDDARVNASVPASAAVLKADGKVFDPVTYPGAGHAFMRLAEEPGASPANKAAADAAWTRWMTLLGGLPR